MRFSLPLAAALAAATALSPALANDSAVRIEAGGIVLEKTDEIRMASEDLFISLHRIAVDYVYENVTGEDVTATIAFPLPVLTNDNDYDFEQHGVDLARPHLGYLTLVDGKEQPSTVRMIVTTQSGEDITAILEEAGVVTPPTYDNPRKWMGLDHATFLHIERLAAKRGVPGIFDRPWNYQIVYIWELSIAAGASVGVHHSYIPHTGGNMVHEAGQPSDGKGWPAYFERTFCATPELQRHIVAVPGLDGLIGYVLDVGYILETGANWAGPIGRFKLTVESERPDYLTMLCWPGEPTKVSDTVMTFEAKDFTPSRNLHVGYLYKAPAPTAEQAAP